MVDVPTAAEQVYELPEGVVVGDEEYYYEYELKRNVIFNNTLNTHQVKYIEVSPSDGATNTTQINGKTVLADENGSPIYVVYASTGIHFMVNDL